MITFFFQIDQLQPSQLYISREKLDELKKGMHSPQTRRIAPVPVMRMGEGYAIRDGHTRCLLAFMSGLGEVRVYDVGENAEGWLYEERVRWCVEDGVTSVVHLIERVVEKEEYQRLWLDRCRELDEMGKPPNQE